MNILIVDASVYGTMFAMRVITVGAVDVNGIHNVNTLANVHVNVGHVRTDDVKHVGYRYMCYANCVGSGDVI